MRMAALSLEHGDPATFVAEFSGADRPVADYLAGEVLVRLPDDVVDFLLRTCVVEDLSVDLAARLSGRDDSAAMLDDLAQRNALVVPLDRSGTWFRYHALLRTYLAAALRRRDPGEVAALRAVAAHVVPRAARPGAGPRARVGGGRRRARRADPAHPRPGARAGGAGAVGAPGDRPAPALAGHAPAVLVHRALLAVDEGDVAAADEALAVLATAPDDGADRADDVAAQGRRAAPGPAGRRPGRRARQRPRRGRRALAPAGRPRPRRAAARARRPRCAAPLRGRPPAGPARPAPGHRPGQGRRPALHPALLQEPRGRNLRGGERLRAGPDRRREGHRLRGRARLGPHAEPGLLLHARRLDRLPGAPPGGGGHLGGHLARRHRHHDRRRGRGCGPHRRGHHRLRRAAAATRRARPARAHDRLAHRPRRLAGAHRPGRPARAADVPEPGRVAPGRAGRRAGRDAGSAPAATSRCCRPSSPRRAADRPTPGACCGRC